MKNFKWHFGGCLTYTSATLCVAVKHSLNKITELGQKGQLQAESTLAEAKGFVRPCPSTVSVVQRNATSFRNHCIVDVQCVPFGKATKKNLTVIVKPFVGCATFDGYAELAEAKGFEPLYRLRGNRISSAGRYDHFDTLPCNLCKYLVYFGSVSKWSAFASLG